MSNKNFLYNMKINFDLNFIKLRTFSKTDFIKGIEYFNNDYVKNITLFKSFNNESLEDVIKVKATLDNNTNTVSNVEIVIDSNGDIIKHKCSENIDTKYNAYFSKEVIAVLLYIYNKNKINFKQNQILDNILEADCLNLIEIYDKITNDESKVNNTNCSISLTPKLYLNKKNYIEIGFSICSNNKTYVIKNLYELITNIENSSDFQYGKNFIINHNINNFDSMGKQLIYFISNLIHEYYDYINIYNYENTYNSIIKVLRIPNSKLGSLLNILKDNPIRLNYNNNVRTVEVIYDNPVTDFVLYRNTITNKYEFLLNKDYINNLHLLISTNNLYAINDKIIYVCNKYYKNKVLPIILKLKDTANKSIYISDINIYKFYSTVINNIKDVTNIKISDEIKDNLNVYTLKKQLFLDTNKKNNIIMNVIFNYNNVDINYFEKDKFDNKNIIRNLHEEYEIISLVKNLGFIEKNNKFILTKEDDIYNLITKNINKLISISEVNVSEKFKKIKYTTPKNISMGVKLVNNLIEIDFDNLEFNLEELKNIIKNYDMKKKYYRLKDGSYINLNYDYFKTIEDLNNDLDLQSVEHVDNKVYVPKYRSLAINTIIENNSNIISSNNSSYKEMVNDLITHKQIDYTIPKCVFNVLRSYQKTGFKWLKTISTFGLGGILADDMGLGKTLQIISLLLDNDNKSIPSIVICPSSLIYNWLKEVEKFAPSINTIALVGNKQQRTLLLENLKNIDLIITSYDLLKRDIEAYEKFSFKYCILDEAQYIKNSYTQNAESVKRINSNVRFALTGTPIENSLSDLWSIFDFIMPNFLLNYNKFKNNYENPIIKNNNTEILHKLHKMIEPFVLRRLKKDVLKDLPDKIVTLSYTEMNETQKKLYLSELIKINEEFKKEIENNGFNKNKIIMLALLTRLRQICCHPSLFLENYNGESAKLNQCMQLVKNCIDSNHKIIIFSQFTTMLDIIASEFDQNNISYYMLTGKTKVNDRITLIDKFNNDDTSVFLISLKAGGTGLNLTSADIVIHFDPWWNNSVENQATDRTHRIGQKNKVQVYKMIVKDTIEEKIQLLQNKKQHLCDSIITEKEVFINSLTKEDIKTLFKI